MDVPMFFYTLGILALGMFAGGCLVLTVVAMHEHTYLPAVAPPKGLPCPVPGAMINRSVDRSEDVWNAAETKVRAAEQERERVEEERRKAVLAVQVRTIHNLMSVPRAYRSTAIDWLKVEEESARLIRSTRSQS